MPADTPPPAYPVDLERVLAAKTVRDAGERALFLAAARELGRDAPPYSAERLERLMRVDEHFQTLHVFDQFEYLRGKAPAGEGDRDFALTAQRICLETANGFQRFLRHREEWAAAADNAELRFRVTGLALNAIHCFVKWGCFLRDRKRIVPWKQLHALYWLAETGAYSQIPLVLHGSQPAFRPAVQALYLRTLVLDLLYAEGLDPVQVEIADGWLSGWCADYSLDAEYSSRSHLFFVDLASDRGLRLVRKDSHGETVRYLRPDGLKAQLEEVQAGLRRGRLYAGRGAGAMFPMEDHVALLAIIEKLSQSMVAGAENRIEERTHLENREVDVVAGMDRFLAKIRRGPEAVVAEPALSGTAVATDLIEISPSGLLLASIEPSHPPAAVTDPDLQTWRVKDLSSKGYGLLVDKASAGAVLLNGIVGIRDQVSGAWILGCVMRKIAHPFHGEVLTGVEVLSFHPLFVQLAPADGGPVIEGLYLPGQDTNGKLDSIAIRAADFSATTPYRLAAGGAIYRIRMNRIVRKGADWVRVRFEIESRA